MTPKLFALLLLPLAAAAQTPDDSLKGRIWTATAQRVWADTKPRAAQPPAWATNQAFKSWLNTTDKNSNGGLGLLLGDVIRHTGKGRPASAAEVARAIMAEASQPPRGREWLGKLDVPALQAAIHQIVPATVPAVAASATAPLATNAPDSLAAPLPVAAATVVDDSSFFGRHPWLTWLLGVLLGALGAVWALGLARQRSRRQHGGRISDTSPSPVHPTMQDSAEVLRLQNEVQRLARYIKGLEAKLLHYENANAADAALGPDTESEPEPALAPPVAPANLPHVPAPAPVATAPAAIAPTPVATTPPHAPAPDSTAPLAE